MRASRAALDEPFSEPERLTGLGVAVMAAPELTEDGLTLFFQGNRDPGAEHTRPFVARRAGTRSAAFEAAAPVLPDLDTVEEWMPFVSLDTQEIFFSGFGGAGVASPSLYRARVCRDGPCPPQEIECPSGTRSPDRLRCYTSSATTSTYAEASARCGAGAGGHLATIHSASEQALVTTLAGADRVWIGLEAHDGAFLWETGEPLLFTDWARDQPDTSLFADCAALSPGSEAGRWSSVLCGAPLRAVCEAELWPSW